MDALGTLPEERRTDFDENCMIGPGKYDNLTTEIRRLTDANGAVLIILDGRIGSGFSAQVEPEAAERMPAILRQVADQMEEDHAKLKGIAGS